MSKLPKDHKLFESLLKSAANALAQEQEQEAELLFAQSQQEEPPLFSDEFDEKIQHLIDYKIKNKKVVSFPKKVLLKYAACFVFVTIICGSLTIMNTTAFRSQIYKFFYEDKQEYTTIDLKPNSNEDYALYKEHDNADYRYPSYLPSGYRLIEEKEHSSMLILEYENQNEDYILITEQQVMGSLASISIDTEDADVVETLTIKNMEGLYIYKDGGSSLLFHDDELSIYIHGQKMDKTEILKIANGLI